MKDSRSMSAIPVSRLAPWAVLILLVCGPASRARDDPDPEPCGELPASVSGMVRGPDGGPVANATVSYDGVDWDADCRMGIRVNHAVTTDSSGRYQIRIPPGKNRWLRFDHPNRARFPMEFETSQILSLIDNRVDHQFRLFRIHGIVLGPGGKPLRDGVVTYYLKPSGPICGSGLPEALIVQGGFEAEVHQTGIHVFSVNPRPGDIGIPSVGLN